MKAEKLTVKAILIYDAVNVFAKALQGLSVNNITAEHLQCTNSPFISWSHGFKLINFMRVVSVYSLSDIFLMWI